VFATSLAVEKGGAERNVAQVVANH